MKTLIILLFTIVSGSYLQLTLCMGQKTGKGLLNDFTPQKPLMAPSVPVTEEVCGMTITDPYRNLENLNDPEVKTWMKAQAGYARTTLDRIPGREKFNDMLKKFDERKGFSLYQQKVSARGDIFYIGLNTGDNLAKLYFRPSGADKEILLFDPETYKNEKGKNWTIMEFYPSPNGKQVILTVAAGGSEIGYLICINVTTRTLLPEVITPVMRYAAWISNSSFTYRTLNSADVHDTNLYKHPKNFVHTPGKPLLKDRDISSSMYTDLDIDSSEKAFIEHPDISSGYFIGVVFHGDRDIRIYSTKDTGFTHDKLVFKELVTKDDKIWDYRIHNNTMFLITSKHASNYKVLQIDLNKPDVAKATVIVPELKNARITDVQVTRDALYVATLTNGVTAGLYRKEYGNKPLEAISLPLPAGSLELITAGSNSNDVWIRASGWLTSGKTFKYNPGKKAFTPLLFGAELVYPELDNLTVEEVVIPSYDGVMVPVSLLYKKGLKRDGNNPLWLQGYGSFGISQTSFFSPLMLLFTQFGGIIGIAHVRGGGELGDAWHEAGTKVNKPNTWKDFIAAAEYMIREKYTSAKKIGIEGSSAGGILIGRAMTERPDLFAVAIPRVGAMNVLRFEHSPNGARSAAEFGTVNDPVECKALLEMDAYHHIKAGTTYPATLITAAINDSRVMAWQPAKFAARLQAADKGTKPLLFLTDYEAGHGVDNTRQTGRRNTIDVMSFILWQTGHLDFQPVTGEDKLTSVLKF